MPFFGYFLQDTFAKASDSTAVYFNDCESQKQARNEIALFFLFVCLLFWFFEIEFLCITALAVLELALVDQAGLKLIEICLPLPPKCWD